MVLLKLAGYGFIRYSINILGEGSIYYIPLVYGISIISIIYSSLTTLRQIDMKKIIAYSSISHMGIVLLGIFSNTIEGLEGSMILMIGHGLVSPGLFIIVTIVYSRYHSRIIKYYRGMVLRSPILSIVFLIFSLANMGVPLTSNFVGELLCLMGAMQTNPILTIIATLGIIIGASYSIWFYNRIIFGARSVYLSSEPNTDIDRREWELLWPLLILIIILGVYPNVVLETLHVSLSKII